MFIQASICSCNMLQWTRCSGASLHAWGGNCDLSGVQSSGSTNSIDFTSQVLIIDTSWSQWYLNTWLKRAYNCSNLPKFAYDEVAQPTLQAPNASAAVLHVFSLFLPRSSLIFLSSWHADHSWTLIYPHNYWEQHPWASVIWLGSFYLSPCFQIYVFSHHMRNETGRLGLWPLHHPLEQTLWRRSMHFRSVFGIDTHMDRTALSSSLMMAQCKK